MRTCLAAAPDALRLDHRFDDLAGVHRLERLVPIGQRPNAADDLADVQLPGGEQPDHPFPDGPVVTEAAAQGDVFLDQRIQRVIERVRDPSPPC